ncbi:MAG: 50S ribosomal protein L19 [Chloroflexi bacterium]|nr:50S ribosomal protein L19 [Chloroflexota bacterium]
MNQELLKAFDAADNPDIPTIHPGDTVRVHVRIVEGERERIQVFQGVVLGLKGSGNNARYTVRRMSSGGIGVERTFLLRSPLVEKVEVIRRARVRRAKLYFLRERQGRSATLRERR